MSDKREREAKIGVAPYSDGSGYQAEVSAYLEQGAGPFFEINITYRLEVEHWPALRQAVEDVLALIGSGKAKP